MVMMVVNVRDETESASRPRLRHNLLPYAAILPIGPVSADSCSAAPTDVETKPHATTSTQSPSPCSDCFTMIFQYLANREFVATRDYLYVL